MSDPIPVSILSGFLGSGKTSFLNRLLRDNHGRKIAVLVNELGEIGLDAALIDAEESMVEMDNGCLCCALNEDLPITLAGLAEIPDLDHIVIETTGIADPFPVARALRQPEVASRVKLDAMITVVDCLNFAGSMTLAEEPIIQVKRCDLALLSKCDLVDEAQVDATRVQVNAINERARILRTDDADCLRLALDLGFESSVLDMEIRGRSDQDAHRHGHEYKTLAISLGRASTIRLAFEDFLEYIPAGVFRAKGIVPLVGERGRLVFHQVGGRTEMKLDENRDDDGLLLFIGKDFDELALREEVACLFALA